MSQPWPPPSDLEITIGQLAEIRQQNSAPHRLIDCREPEEWDICRIEGAELFPLGDIPVGFADRLPHLDEPIVVYCHHGMRSGKATQFLRQKGYQRVWSLQHGIDGWSLDQDPAVPRY